MEKTAKELEKELATSKAQAEENIKALQKKLTDKDLETKKILEEIAELKKKGSGDSEADKKIETMTKTVAALTEQIATLNADKRKAELQKKFPEILPELLLGKSDEEAEIIANKQKELTMKNYDLKPSAHEPIYKDRDAVDKEISRVKEDKTLSTEAKLQKLRELKLKREEI